MTRRSKINCTWSGRPMSRFSRSTSSKKTRPCAGRSKTSVRANSACRIETVVANALLPVAGANGCGSRASHLRSSASTRAAVRVSASRCMRWGLSHRRMPLSSASNAIPRFVSCPLQILVPVDAQLGVVRKVRAELQEERPEVVVHGVDVGVLPQNLWVEWRTRRSSSDSQGARVLTGRQGASLRSAPRSAGLTAWTPGSAHARPGSCLTTTNPDARIRGGDEPVPKGGSSAESVGRMEDS